ncbi:MAG: hypothetical protein Q9169_004690 [Polycauliona sp. 2 TL-2023]
MFDAAPLRPPTQSNTSALNTSNKQAPFRKIYYPPAPQEQPPPNPQQKKISRFFPPWHPDVVAARMPPSPPTSTSISTSTSATTSMSNSAPTLRKPKPFNSAHREKAFTPITIITTITSITTVTSLSPMTTTTVITDVTNTTLSPAKETRERERTWQRRKNGKGLKIETENLGGLQADMDERGGFN